MFIAIIVNFVDGGLVTDFQQIDSNILDNANIWFINRIDSESALQFSVIVNSDYATEQYLAEDLQDWINTKDSTTQKLFYFWIEDIKRQSQISRKTFEELSPVLPPQIGITFRRALKSFYRTDISQSEKSDNFRALKNQLSLEHQKILDQVYYQVYERATFHFLTPLIDYDEYIRQTSKNEL
uniref:Uncharacterized protein n=1 Tax=Panagrolaimus sp. PS1159 TaxID=55785 RepID=A0AC35F8F4_9BILA